MAIVFPGKYVFLCHARTGSAAVSDALVRFHGATRSRGHHDNIKQLSEHLKGGEVIFCTVRNPFDVLASWLVNSQFSTIPDVCSKLHHTNFRNIDGNLFSFHSPQSHYILKWESLKPGLDQLLDRLDLPRVPLKIVNQSKNKKPYREYYTSDDVTLVEKEFANDINSFNYSF